MATTYPAQIDTNITIPRVTDNLTPVTGSVYNNLQEAVIRIEQELGVKPSGTYSTVRARLDALEGILNRLNLSGIFGGDLEAQPDPSIQHVIGIHGNSIAINTSIPAGASLRWDGYVWNQTNLYQDDILPPFFITLNGMSIREVNQTLSYPAFTATYNFDPPTSIVLTDTDGNSQTILEAERFLFNSDNVYQKTVFDGYVTFTLSAVHHNKTKTASYTIMWGQKLYWGVGPTGYSTASDITTNLTGTITTSVAANFTLTAGLTEKIYFACRSAYGTPTFTVGGFDGGFSLVSDTISLTNDYGFTENYALYESDNFNLGTTTVTVS